MRLAGQCQRWGALPDTGGVRDQSVRLMRDMAAASDAYVAMRGFWLASKQARVSEWRKNNPEVWRYVQDILKLEEEHNG